MSFTFKKINGDSREFNVVKDLFQKVIAPLYGDQTQALEKISRSDDRNCEILFDDQKPVGIIVYKSSLQEGNLECKTLCLIDSGAQSKKGYGSVLLNRLIDKAIRTDAGNIALSVSASNPAIAFFQHKGFVTAKEEKDKYVVGDVEIFMTLPVSPVKKASLAAAEIAPKIELAKQPKPIIEREHIPKIRRIELDSSTAIESSAAAEKTFQRPKEEEPFRSRYRQVDQKPITCSLKKCYIDAISSGKKTFEGRVATPFFSDYQPGRVVVWQAGNNASAPSVTTEITSRTRYSSFREMLQDVGYQKMVPEARSLDHAVSLYDAIPGYSEKVKRQGALALGVKKIAPIAQASSQDRQKATPASQHRDSFWASRASSSSSARYDDRPHEHESRKRPRSPGRG